MKEAQIEKWLNDRIREMGGGLSYKFFSPPDNPGVPDRIYIFPMGEVWFVELKTEIGKMSGIQRWQRERISGMGCNYRLIKGMKQAREFIKELEAQHEYKNQQL